jgi:predicted metal-binding membrane protein
VSGARAQYATLAHTLRWAPEWPIAAAAALAWVAVAAHAGGPTWSAPPGHEHHQHLHGSVGAALPAWAVMTLAMMVPVTLPAVRHVSLNSLRRRRGWAMALYTATYVVVASAWGLVLIAGYRTVHASLMLDERVLLTCALVLAGTWQLTRSKRRAVLACKRTVPLPPVGWRADVGCARFATAQAMRCMRSCWAMMLVMVAAGHGSLVWMATLTSLIWIEELTVAGRRLIGHVAVALGVLSVMVALGV